MTREEAARVLSGMLDDYRISSWDDDWYYGENVDALNVAIAALRDPDTGCPECSWIDPHYAQHPYCKWCGRKLEEL